MDRILKETPSIGWIFERKVKSLAKNSFAFLRILKIKSLIKPRDETQGKEGRENVKIPMTRIIKGEISVGEGMENYRVIFL